MKPNPKLIAQISTEKNNRSILALLLTEHHTFGMKFATPNKKKTYV
jgi:hypothetical protein